MNISGLFILLKISECAPSEYERFLKVSFPWKVKLSGIDISNLSSAFIEGRYCGSTCISYRKYVNFLRILLELYLYLISSVPNSFGGTENIIFNK